jgi:methionyl-tRNA formyltransferase
VRVLFLGPDDSAVLAYLREAGEEVTAVSAPIGQETISAERPEFVVSYGYRHILRPHVLELIPARAINLHIALLPWNRGADPNLWSWIEGTPKGVTIHYIDQGVDTGDVIAQREVRFGAGETLASSYARLQEEMLRLFREQWPLIRAGRCERWPQAGAGSFHRVSDRRRVEPLLVAGWDTAVAALRRPDDP